MSEIYNRGIEIYAYSNKPMKTFHEPNNFKDKERVPIRLSYHGNSHYNCIVPKNWNSQNNSLIADIEPGQIEL
jgi:hypothetical protein